MAKLSETLELYRAAVQHPQAEVAFLHRVYQHHRRRSPLLLREDFAGTAAVACAWVDVDEDHQAMAIDSHSPTVRWALKQAQRELGERAADLHLVCADVMSMRAPKVDVLAALNFSTFIFHDRAALLAYFRNARRSLRPGGILVIDAYGGPGAMRPQTQCRKALTHTGERFEYQWEQRGFNAVTHQVDNRIHFVMKGGRLIRDAFRYDWRLWSLPELTEMMLQAGFANAQVWCDQVDTKTKQSDGAFTPMKQMREREDWVAYVVGS